MSLLRDAVSVAVLACLCGPVVAQETLPSTTARIAEQLEGWPAGVTADLGDLEVRFESRSFWTLYRIDYKGTRLCLDRFGSHYGSVANFPGVGFIGSGHTENEEEQILDLKLFLDGSLVKKPEPTTGCREIRLVKTSRIRDLVLNTEISVRNGRIIEEVRLKADKPTPVTLIYHFMHPWTPTATEYCAELLDGTLVDGVFTGDRAHKIDKATRWSAIYDGPSGTGAVTRVIDVPRDDDWRTRYWDVPDRYRKHYLVTFLNETVPADREFCYRIVTVPFEATQQQWKAEATRTAKACRSLDKTGGEKEEKRGHSTFSSISRMSPLFSPFVFPLCFPFVFPGA